MDRDNGQDTFPTDVLPLSSPLQPTPTPGPREALSASDAAPVVSVIVPVYNGGSDFARCLAALRAAPQTLPWELLVVDDGSSDGSAARARAAGARVLSTPRPRSGPAVARNRGAAAARGELLLFVDADVLVYPDTVARIAASFWADPGLDALFGSYDDRPAAPDFLSQYRNLLHHYVHQTSRAEATTFWAGCGAIRRDVFLALGGFDLAYSRPCVEDIALGYRLTRAGHRIRLCHDLQVTHLKRWTPLRMLRTDIRDRGIPWTRLLLREGQVPSDLNLRPASRLSAAGVYLLGASTLGAVLEPWLLALTLPIVATLLAALPWHWTYFAYSALSFILGALLHLRDSWAGRRLVGGIVRGVESHAVDEVLEGPLSPTIDR